MRRTLATAALAAAVLAGCASILNAPINQPSTPAFLAQSQQPRDIGLDVGRNTLHRKLCFGSANPRT